MIFVSLEQVLEIHAYQLEKHGGLPGIKDIGLVESALNAVHNWVFYEYCEDPFALAGLLLYRITNNHGFEDGNKRVGLHVSLYFMQINGVFVTPRLNFLYDLTYKVASREVTEAETIEILRSILTGFTIGTRELLVIDPSK